MSVQVKVALPTRCVLGEGLHWDRRQNLLWFVDIHGRRVFWFDPDTKESGSRDVPETVGWALSIEASDRVLVGLKSGIALLDVFGASDVVEWVDREFPADADQRLNDAKADKHGRLWYGSVSVSDESRSVGSLACYDAKKGGTDILDAGYRVANGPAFREDCTIMLHSDSARQITYRFEVDAETGAATNRTVWNHFAEDDGFPDGMTFDADGCVWIAHWGAGKVCRYDVHGNRLLTIRMPTTNVTNVCFGGRDMTRMFVTSASHGLNDIDGRSQVNAGALFEVFGLGVRGFPSWQIRM